MREGEQISDMRVYVSENRKTVYMNHLDKDTHEGMSAGIFLNKTGWL